MGSVTYAEQDFGDVIEAASSGDLPVDGWVDTVDMAALADAHDIDERMQSLSSASL